jgi:SH3 and cysteine-rich domain-containing protein 2
MNNLQAIEQSKRYDNLAIQSKNISGQQDLTNFSRILPVPPNALRVPKKVFAPPQPPATAEGEDPNEYNVSFQNHLGIFIQL